MAIAIDEVSASITESPREAPPMQMNMRQPLDPEAVMRLIRREKTRIERLKAD